MTFSDTTDDAALAQLEAQRRLGAIGRLRVAIQMSELTRQLAKAGLRSRCPNLDERQLHQALIAQLYQLKVPGR